MLADAGEDVLSMGRPDPEIWIFLWLPLKGYMGHVGLLSTR